MGRLPRFADHRFIGTRDTMRVYDCDDDGQYRELENRVDVDDLFQRDLLQTFGPDTIVEAENRGFSPAE